MLQAESPLPMTWLLRVISIKVHRLTKKIKMRSDLERLLGKIIDVNVKMPF